MNRATSVNRREFLGIAALTATLPGFLVRTGHALAGDPRGSAAPLEGLKGNHVLVVVQLAGGNDGLNTVVPFADDAYRKARPKLAVDAKKVLKVTDALGFHPEMTDLKSLYDDGLLAVLQNVGYPNPNRSHFRATEIWESGSDATREMETGWLGRYFDNECRGVPSPMLGLQVGERPAQSFAHPASRAVTLGNADLFKWPTSGPVAAGLERLNTVSSTENETLDFLQRSANRTLSLSRRIQEAVRCSKTSKDYLPFAFQQSLKLVAQMIAAEIPTRVYYVSLGGFDTHANQTNRHAALLQELSQGLATFCRDLKDLGHLDRTLVMTFSEFGRRVEENDSGGTDHGTAAPLFLAGGKVKPGLHGEPPNLADLDSGDLRFKTDFRSVYATILKQWFLADPKKVFEAEIPMLPILA
jgi:uncharacterized protein (DUF1501 family)